MGMVMVMVTMMVMRRQRASAPLLLANHRAARSGRSFQVNADGSSIMSWPKSPRATELWFAKNIDGETCVHFKPAFTTAPS
jgi:hypothetical protein